MRLDSKKIFQRALEILTTDGWTTGSMRRSTGYNNEGKPKFCYCLTGALIQAVCEQTQANFGVLESKLYAQAKVRDKRRLRIDRVICWNDNFAPSNKDRRSKQPPPAEIRKVLKRLGK